MSELAPSGLIVALCGLLVCGVGPGCREGAPAAADPDDVDTALTGEAEADDVDAAMTGEADDDAPPAGPSAVHRVWQTAKTDHARFMALAGNRDGHRHDVEVRYPRLFEELEVGRRVPDAFDAVALREAFARHAETLGLSIQDFEASLRAHEIPSDRTLPDHLGPDEPFKWLQDEIRREIDVTLTVTPADLARLEQWFGRRGQVGPMFLVDGVQLDGEAARIRLTAYHFVPEVKVPLRRIPPFDADAILRDAGIDPGGPAADPGGAGIDPAGPALAPAGADTDRIAEIRALYDEVNGRLDEINEALAHRSRADLWDVKNGFFHQTARRVEAQRWVDVLR